MSKSNGKRKSAQSDISEHFSKDRASSKKGKKGDQDPPPSKSDRDGGDSDDDTDQKSSKSAKEPSSVSTIRRKYESKIDDETTVLTIKKIQPLYTLNFKSPSDYGIRSWESKQKGKNGTLIKFSIDEKEGNSIKSYLEQVDQVAHDFVTNVMTKEAIFSEFNISDKKLKSEIEWVYNGGTSNEGLSELTFFPGQFTVWGEYDALKKKALILRKDTPLITQVDKLANSKWIVEIGINSMVITYNSFKKCIEVAPYMNLSRLVWMNFGQNTMIDPDELKKLKEQEELSRWAFISSSAKEWASEILKE